MRYAIIRNISVETAERYLPGNYHVLGNESSISTFDTMLSTERYVVIAGEDNAGWTLDDYVIPRLQSGLYGCKEITADESIDLCGKF